jgi:uncharacterized protein (TIGR00251 family)
MIHLTDHAEGIILPVRAQPKARRPGVQGEQAGALKLGVSAPPEDGKANQALIELLSETLGIRRAQIALLSGATSRDKKFLLRGLSRAELETRLTELLASS